MHATGDDHPAIQHVPLNRLLVNGGDGVLIGEQNNRLAFVLMPFQGAGKIKPNQIAVEQWNIQLFAQPGDKTQAHVEGCGPGGLQIVHAALTMFRDPHRGRDAAQEVTGNVFDQLFVDNAQWGDAGERF